MRAGEAMRLEWSDVDLARGAVKLDTNKTDDPRAWALDPGVVRALAVLRKMNPNTKFIFEADGERFESRGRNNARQLRIWLADAGIERAELTERSANRIPLRLHDMRATFATCAFANGKSEAWITDRTGHKSSTQLYNYKRTARTWAELNLGTLAALDEAIPELSEPLTK
jgi:integrase